MTDIPLPDAAPKNPACRCGSGMELDDIEEAGTSLLVIYTCSCGRGYGVQVRDGRIINTEREEP